LKDSAIADSGKKDSEGTKKGEDLVGGPKKKFVDFWGTDPKTAPEQQRGTGKRGREVGPSIALGSKKYGGVER